MPAMRLGLRVIHVSCIMFWKPFQEPTSAVAVELVYTFPAKKNEIVYGATHQVAAGDGRIGAIALLFAPVIGWVLFNIGTTAFHLP